MNTIRREIVKEMPCNSDKSKTQSRTLAFEGEKGEFNITLTSRNPFEGTNWVSISLNEFDALMLYKSLSNFLGVKKEASL